MTIEIKIPETGESIQEVQIAQWLKQEGDWVRRDESLVEVETDKASVDLPAPADGILTKILKRDGETVEIGQVIAELDDDAKPPPEVERPLEAGRLQDPLVILPAAQRLLAEYGLQGREVPATGPEGRLLKEDVLRHVQENGLEKLAEQRPSDLPPTETPPAKPVTAQTPVPPEKAAPPIPAAPPTAPPPVAAGREEEAVAMSLIRRRIAARLVEAQQTAALLTTFNEIDMSAVMSLRKQFRETFEKKHAVRLGFMSFFVKAVVESLKQWPALNAEIRETTIVYRNYFDVGIAIGGARGLVVPILRNAERMSFSEIEKAIGDFAQRAKSNKLTPDDLAGGTFTITNGGVYGSLLSTPIVNPPQSGVLGMHKIQERPVAIDGQVVIRPMMYVALTYDHRIVDGEGAVRFLCHVKDIIEEPSRMLLEV